jgi:hypothetical protein
VTQKPTVGNDSLRAVPNGRGADKYLA